MIDTSIQERLNREFSSSRGKYSDFARLLEGLLGTLIDGGGYTVHSVTGRCKTLESLAKKLTLPEKSYKNLSDITDITGIRITTYFSEDVDAIAKIIENEFNVDEANSVDKRQSLDPDRFGYQSLHYVAALTPTRCNLGEYRKFKGIRFEIQLRSILQHAWAEIEHDLGYKSAVGVPRQIRRRFARVASLLELADAEFSAIRGDLIDYGNHVRTEIQSAESTIELNLPSLQALYDTNSSVKALDTIVGRVAGSNIFDDIESIDGFQLELLQKIGIKTVQALEDAARSHHDDLSDFAVYWLKGAKYDELPMGVGLFYLTFLLLAITRDRQLIFEFCHDRFTTPLEVSQRLLEYPPKDLPKP